MTKQPKKQQFIGRDMHKEDVNSGFCDLPGNCRAKSRQPIKHVSAQTGQDQTSDISENNAASSCDETNIELHAKRDIGNIVSSYAFEIIIAAILFFIVISSAFSYELARPLLQQQAQQDSLLVKFFRPDEELSK